MSLEALPSTEKKVLLQITLNPGEEIQYAIATLKPTPPTLLMLVGAIAAMLIIAALFLLQDFSQIMIIVAGGVIAFTSIMTTNITHYILAASNRHLLLVRYHPNKKLSVKRQWAWPLNEVSYQIAGPAEGPISATVKAGQNEWKLKVKLSYADHQLQLRQIEGLQGLTV